MLRTLEAAVTIVGVMLSIPSQVPQPPQAPPFKFPRIEIPSVPKATVKVRVESAPLLGPGWHRHQCQGCKHVWSHGPPSNSSHACPRCGKEYPGNRVHYTGPTPFQWIEQELPKPSRTIPKSLPSSLDNCDS